jgi:hypothetical protein
MAREVDPRTTRKALRRVRKLTEASASEGAGPYSDWEQAFLAELDQRLETYGSAFHDASKGRLDEALSTLQDVKLKEIAAKARAGSRAKRQGARAPVGDAAHENDHPALKTAPHKPRSSFKNQGRPAGGGWGRKPARPCRDISDPD